MVAKVNWPDVSNRLNYVFHSAGRCVALVVAFVSIWFVCIWLGFVIPMNTLDRDVGSVAAATIFSALGGILGPFVAYFVIRSIRRGGV